MKSAELRAWSFSDAERALRSAVVPSTRVEGVEPVRLGSSAVFRVIIDGRQIAARIVSPEIDRSRLSREAAFARALNQAGVRAVLPADWVAGPEPVITDHGTVGFWQWIEHDEAAAVDPAEFGRLLRSFHDNSVGLEHLVPPFRPLQVCRTELIEMVEQDRVTAEQAEPIFNAINTTLAVLEQNQTNLGTGPVHGDAHPGNVLVASDGLVLIDFDLCYCGPREWDLIPLVSWADRYGWSGTDLCEFIKAYGPADLEFRPWHDAITAGRRIVSVLWSLRNRHTNQQAAERCAIRLAAWRDPLHPDPWVS